MSDSILQIQAERVRLSERLDKLIKQRTELYRELSIAQGWPSSKTETVREPRVLEEAIAKKNHEIESTETDMFRMGNKIAKLEWRKVSLARQLHSREDALSVLKARLEERRAWCQTHPDYENALPRAEHEMTLAEGNIARLRREIAMIEGTAAPHGD